MSAKHKHEEIVKMTENFDTVLQLVSKISNAEVKAAITTLVKETQSKFLVAPNATKLGFPGAYHGGLVSTSLAILRSMIKINDALSLELSKDDMIIVGLFHNIGKIGTQKQDYYIPQNSQWHRDNLGQMFKINEDIDDNLSPHIRSLQILNNAGVTLSSDVFAAIISLSNMSGETPASTQDIYKAPDLVTVFQTAFKLATSDAAKNPKHSVLG